MDPDRDGSSLRASSPVARIWRWTIVDGNRAVIAALLAVATFGVTLAVGAAGVLPLDSPRLTQHILSRLVASTIPFVTIVAAANQIVLTMDLGPLSKLRSEVDEMRDFREAVEDTVDVAVSPTHPSTFLELLADRLVDCVERTAETSTDESVREVTEPLAAEAATLRTTLDDADVTDFRAGAALLHFDPGWHLSAVRNLRARRDLSEPTRENLAAMERVLEQTDVARQHFKTLHTEHELASLSRAILFAGLPATVGGGLLVLSYAELAALLPRSAALVLLAAAVALVFLPFLVLVAYMLRVAEIARRTADFGPFVAG